MAKAKDWKGKTTNLSKPEVAKGRRVVGGGRKTERVTTAERKAARKAVDISGTQWQTAKQRGGKGVGGLLTDASGKAVTGTVTLPSGKKAVYVRGKRVQAQPVKPSGTGGGKGSGGNDGKPTAPKPSGPGKPNFSGKLKNMPSGDARRPNQGRPPKPGEYQAGSLPRQNTNPKYGASKTEKFVPVGGRGVGLGSMPNVGRSVRGYKGWERDALITAATVVAAGFGGGLGGAARGAAGLRAAANAAKGGRTAVTFGKPVRTPGGGGASRALPAPKPLKALESSNKAKLRQLKGPGRS